MPTDDPNPAPFQYHTISYNDRDPRRSQDFAPGAAWMNTVRFDRRAAAFQTVQISPREALRRAEDVARARGDKNRDSWNAHLELVLGDLVPGELHAEAVWQVTFDRNSQDIWINARDGALIPSPSPTQTTSTGTPATTSARLDG